MFSRDSSKYSSENGGGARARNGGEIIFSRDSSRYSFEDGGMEDSKSELFSESNDPLTVRYLVAFLLS